MAKFLSAEQAVELIADDATVVIGGTGVVLEPLATLLALEERFVRTSRPLNLTIVAPMCPGDRPGEGGLNCVAHEGMLGRLIGSSFNRKRHPRLHELLEREACEGYTLPMGALVQLMTAIGSGKPGVHTTSGIGTFLDPRIENGRMNSISNSAPGRIESLDGMEYIFYPSFPVNVAIIRATTADENGYLSLEEEPNTLGLLELAMAAKASGGLVIAQVKRVAAKGSLDARLVRVPGPLVDVVVVDPLQTQLSPSMADPLAGANPFLAGGMRRPLSNLEPVAHGPARLILRRAALELRPNDVVNIGAGVATDLPRIVHEDGAHGLVTFTNEHGVFGGMMGTALGGSFVPALNADAIMDSAFQFNYYTGGGLDITFLGMGQVDQSGNVNVSKFGNLWNGPGGFADITDKTARIVICGAFTAGGLKTRVGTDGRLTILSEGRQNKFVTQVEQITLSGKECRRKQQCVRYVTERAVFELQDGGLTLVEIAPGIDLDNDILSVMDFRPIISKDLKLISDRVATEGALNLPSLLSPSQE